MTMPIDSQGFPGTEQPDGSIDGGDTAAIVGTIIALQTKLPASSFIWMANSLLSENGIPRRHWDNTKWYGQENRFSRDQLIPMICAAIRYVDTPAFDKYLAAHKKRFFLTAWNTRKNGVMETPWKFPDITGPEIWALWIRYKSPWWGFAFLWIFDLELFINAIIWRFRTDRVTRNFMLSCITCKKYRPTILSRIAYAISDFDTLIARWAYHCLITKEWDTSYLFMNEMDRLKGKGPVSQA